MGHMLHNDTLYKLAMDFEGAITLYYNEYCACVKLSFISSQHLPKDS